ncbi:L-threonine 3-dehydrogenase [Mycolicibacterium rhodesiae JS60]|nr:L-threonine 3-dehydrogenase [Mycolicibacterium rhodesiae JS60]
MSATVAIPQRGDAAVMTAFGTAPEVRSIPVPTELEPGAVLVQVVAATVCGTDVHMWNGSIRPNLPVQRGFVLGHECVGRVVLLGDGAGIDSVGNRLEIGDRIVWTGASCGHCTACTVWRHPGLCASRLGTLSTPVDVFPYATGAFAEYAYVHPRSERVLVPDGIPSTWASAASCALRTAVHAIERAGPGRTTDVAVVQGAGPVGLCTLALLRHAGTRTIVIGGPPNRLDIAMKWGAEQVIGIDDADPAERADVVRELTGHGADLVIEASGAATAFGEALQMVRPGGRVVVAGAVTADQTPVSAGLIAAKQLTIAGVWSARIDHYWQALQFLQDSRSSFDFGLLISGTYDLGTVSDALVQMASGREIKPVIRTGPEPKSED